MVKNPFFPMEKLAQTLSKRVRKLSAGGQFVRNLPSYSRTIEFMITGRLLDEKYDEEKLLKKHEFECAQFMSENTTLKCIISRQGAELLVADGRDPSIGYLGENFLLQFRLKRIMWQLKTLQDEVGYLTRRRTDSRYQLRRGGGAREAILMREERQVEELENQNEMLSLQIEALDRQIAAANGETMDDEFEVRKLPLGIHNVFAMLAKSEWS